MAEVSDDQLNIQRDSLRYELKVLYEYGEQQYVFKSDGSKPEQFYNIVNDSAIGPDPRMIRDYSAQAPPDNSGFGYS